MFWRFFYIKSRNKDDAISPLSPCVKLSTALYATAVKLRTKTPPGSETSSAVPLGYCNKMSQ